MSDKKSFYVTSPIFYPNANLHMGHAYTMTICDILARYHKLVGDSTYFLTGADENTGKILKAAGEQKKTSAEFLDGITDGFKKLYADLGISYDQFIRTSDKEKHWPGALAMWKKLQDAGDIYKAKYTGLYCIGCEAFYTEKDLIDGKCPIHGTIPEKIEEENYFFKFSKYTSQIKEKIQSKELNIIPESRHNEIVALLERGLEDVSFSRPLKNVPHGIPVPGDPEQVIYVWCDALVNYISALGFGSENDELFKKFWPVNIHVIGKDILRFHAALWPAMLLSAGLALPKNILVHGLITSGSKKMSKSLGNVIDPLELLAEYGKDALRFFIAKEISLFDDGDMTKESFKAGYNAYLANGIGNLTNRILKMAETNLDAPLSKFPNTIPESYHEAFRNFDINKAASIAWEEISAIDKTIQSTEPFKVVKIDKEKGKQIIEELCVRLYNVARMLHAIIPETAETIIASLKANKMPEKPLFARKD